MRKFIDLVGGHSTEIAEHAYTNNFLRQIRSKFNFDALKSEYTVELREIAADYIYWRRLQIRKSPSRKDQRRKYLKLQKFADRFLHQLEQCDKMEIETLLFIGARKLRAPALPGRLIDFSQHKKQKGLPFYREFVQFLEFIKIGADEIAEDYKLPSGRRRNFGLENLTIKSAEFWEKRLGRKFTLDYHGGTGLTKAFEFVRDLVAPLDDVTDKNIITAMRSEIKERRKNRGR
jgi:hypothetical protein